MGYITLRILEWRYVPWNISPFAYITVVLGLCFMKYIAQNITPFSTPFFCADIVFFLLEEIIISSSVTYVCEKPYETGKIRYVSYKMIMASDNIVVTLQWRHNGWHGVSNHHYINCLLNRLFKRKRKKTSELGVIMKQCHTASKLSHECWNALYV